MGFQDAKVMSEHEVDINASIIIGLDRTQRTKVAKASFILETRLISRWSDWEQSRAAELATNTDPTTKTIRNRVSFLGNVQKADQWMGSLRTLP